MLLVNKKINEVPSHGGSSFDRDGWDALVAPRVEGNLCRKRFATIQKMRWHSQPVLPSGRELWLVWRGNLRWHGCGSSLRTTTTSFAVT
jgi:hypothetical protein